MRAMSRPLLQAERVSCFVRKKEAPLRTRSSEKCDCYEMITLVVVGSEEAKTYRGNPRQSGIFVASDFRSQTSSRGR